VKYNRPFLKLLTYEYGFKHLRQHDTHIASRT